MPDEELLAAVRLLASLDHFDVSRRASAQLPDDLPVVEILRAADGVQQLARAVDTRRRVEASKREREEAAGRSTSLYS